MMSTYLRIPLVAFLASFILTPMAARLDPRLGAMDRPKALSIHTRPTSRTAGLAVLAGFVLAAGCAACSSRLAGAPREEGAIG